MSVNRDSPQRGGSFNRPGVPGRRDPRYQPAPPSELPPDYLKNGYFDEKGNVIDQVIVVWPQKIANDLYQSHLKTAQLRKFFSEVKRIERKLEISGDFNAIRPEVLKLDCFAEESVKKGKAPPLFHKFIKQNLRWATKDKKSFTRGFVNHFECLVGVFRETS